MRLERRQRSRERMWYLSLFLLVGACVSPEAIIGLRPEYPPIGAYYPDFGFVEVNSLQPTLRWEAFPRPQDLAADTERLLGRLTPVTYDLEIWLMGIGGVFPWRESGSYFPWERVYVKQGLPEAAHRIEQRLAPSTMYFWTVRARFQINGEPRVTEWGMYERGYAELEQRFGDLRPHPLYSRFKTPPQ